MASIKVEFLHPVYGFTFYVDEPKNICKGRESTLEILQQQIEDLISGKEPIFRQKTPNSGPTHIFHHEISKLGMWKLERFYDPSEMKKIENEFMEQQKAKLATNGESMN